MSTTPTPAESNERTPAGTAAADHPAVIPVEVLNAFRARGLDDTEARTLFERAGHDLDPAVRTVALDTLVQTRVLTWPECITYARLLRPEGKSAADRAA
jgi:hypothetical protein